MRLVIFSESALKRIASIKSARFTKEETAHFQNKLIEAIRYRLSYVHLEGYKEYNKGPWANTRRVVVKGFKVYFTVDLEENMVKVRGIKAPGMK